MTPNETPEWIKKAAEQIYYNLRGMRGAVLWGTADRARIKEVETTLLKHAPCGEGWVSVKERLPDKGADVAFVLRNGHTIYTGAVVSINKKKFFDTETERFSVEEVGWWTTERVPVYPKLPPPANEEGK